MIFKRRVLEGIADGSITLAFRRWTRPAVRPGSRMRTDLGVVEIDALDEVDRVTPEDARRAGYATPDELWKELSRFPNGVLYRISLHLAGPDPRALLRDRDDPAEAAAACRELARMDRASRRGPWTSDLLHLIQELPATPALLLAERLGRDTAAVKRDVRRLKELGLTESLSTGYRLSPRGVSVIRLLGDPSTP